MFGSLEAQQAACHGVDGTRPGDQTTRHRHGRDAEDSLAASRNRHHADALSDCALGDG